MPLPVRAASTVERSLEGHSSQSGAVAPTLAPTGEAAAVAPALDPVLVVAGVAMPPLVPAPSAGVVVETLAVPKGLALPDSGEAAVDGEPVIAPRLLLAESSCSDGIEPPGSTVVVVDVVDPVVAAVVVGDAATLPPGEPMVWARAAGTAQQRHRRAPRNARRHREVDTMGCFRQRPSRSKRRICAAVPG
jgi:hypothetical protein